MNEPQVEPAIAQHVVFECLDAQGRAGALDATLTYDVNDPYAVTVSFHTRVESVAWTFARELLSAGFDRPSGSGDVEAYPAIDCEGCAATVLELHAPEGSFVAQARTADLRHFLTSTCDVVPLGSELAHLDLDEMIRALLDR